MSGIDEEDRFEVVVPDRNPDRPQPLPWDEYTARVLHEWNALLDSNPEEREVHEFLESHPAMVPGGSGDIGPGGHHGSTYSAVFSKPTLKGLGRDFDPDFMWVTRSTSLVTPILIEIEKPSKRWFRRDGRPTQEFTQAHDQLNDWRSWFAQDVNASVFRSTYMLGDERFEDRPLEPWFVLVYGRAAEFEPIGGHADPAALRHKRDTQRATHEAFMTFDSLTPNYKHRSSMTVKMTATGPEAIAFSPHYGTSTSSGEVMTSVRDVTGGLDRSVMMTAERRDYLKDRFRHWADRDERARHDAVRTGIRSTGLE